METIPYETRSFQQAAGSSVVVMSHTLLPIHTNADGTAFGGQIMAWMDICAGTTLLLLTIVVHVFFFTGIAAKRHCMTAVVTASMDDLHFRNTAKVGCSTCVPACTLTTSAHLTAFRETCKPVDSLVHPHAHATSTRMLIYAFILSWEMLSL